MRLVYHAFPCFVAIWMTASLSAQSVQLPSTIEQSIDRAFSFTRFAEIPEPGSYAALLALFTVSFAVVRRWRGRSFRA